jgi:hypothetical protein
VQIRKLIERSIRERRDGVDVAADVNAAISINVGEQGATTRVSGTQRVAPRSDGQPAEGDHDDPRRTR